MINLIITTIGVVLLILGFSLMSFGFSTPPNGLFFFLGLCAAVVGLILVVFFVSGVEITGRSSPIPSNVSKTESTIKPRPKPVKMEKMVPMQNKKEATLDNIKKTIKSEEPVKPKPRIISPKKTEHPEEPVKPKPRIIKPKKADNHLAGQKSIKTERKIESKEELMKTNESLSTQKKPPIKKIPKKPDMNKLSSMQPEKDDDYVKKRLDRLKAS